MERFFLSLYSICVVFGAYVPTLLLCAHAAIILYGGKDDIRERLHGQLKELSSN